MANKKSIQSANSDVAVKNKPLDLALLSAIETVAEKAKDSKLSDQFFIDCKNELRFIADSYGITPHQAVLFCTCMTKGARYIDFEDLASYLDINPIRILTYGADIDALVHRRLLRYSGSRRKGDSFEVPLVVINSLKHNIVYKLPKRAGLDAAEMMEYVSMWFNDIQENTVSAKELREEMEALIDENKQLPIAHKIKDLVLDNEDMALVLFLCHKLVNEEDDDVSLRDLEDIYDDKAEFNRLKARLRRGDFYLMREKIIEVTCEDGIANNTRYKLTESAKRDLLSEFNITTAEEKIADVLDPESFTAKELFYSDSNARQVDELFSLLQPESYKQIHDRMQQRGFRQGFACLFHGGPGTGKTETVYQLARRTGRKVMLVDVPQIRSKWVGESEKNIKALFDRYRALVAKYDLAPILLFNEADAIVGIRMQGAQDAVDKMENTIQNIILQEMESLDGILIATTNLTENLDTAFERLFLYKIRFDKPDAPVRGKIWKQMIPELPSPLTESLALKYDFSGGQIENIARKYAVTCILHGEAENPQQTLEEFCDNEKINNVKVRRIGF